MSFAAPNIKGRVRNNLALNFLITFTATTSTVVSKEETYK